MGKDINQIIEEATVQPLRELRGKWEAALSEIELKELHLSPRQKELLLRARIRPCGTFPERMANGNTIKALTRMGLVERVGYSSFCLATIYGLTENGTKQANWLHESMGGNHEQRLDKVRALNE